MGRVCEGGSHHPCPFPYFSAFSSADDQPGMLISRPEPHDRLQKAYNRRNRREWRDTRPVGDGGVLSRGNGRDL